MRESESGEIDHVSATALPVVGVTRREIATKGMLTTGPGHRAGDEEGLRRENTVQPFDVVGARQRAVGGKASIQMLLSILVDNRQPALVGLEELLGRRTESCVVPIAKLRTGYESIQPGHGGSGLSILGE
jgi:hypothetical protein